MWKKQQFTSIYTIKQLQYISMLILINYILSIQLSWKYVHINASCILTFIYNFIYTFWLYIFYHAHTITNLRHSFAFFCTIYEKHCNSLYSIKLNIFFSKFQWHTFTSFTICSRAQVSVSCFIHFANFSRAHISVSCVCYILLVDPGLTFLWLLFHTFSWLFQSPLFSDLRLILSANCPRPTF